MLSDAFMNLHCMTFCQFLVLCFLGKKTTYAVALLLIDL